MEIITTVNYKKFLDKSIQKQPALNSEKGFMKLSLNKNLLCFSLSLLNNRVISKILPYIDLK